MDRDKDRRKVVEKNTGGQTNSNVDTTQRQRVTNKREPQKKESP